MSAKRVDVHRLQEMVRLHRLGLSSREIARQLKMGRDTIRSYCRIFREVDLLEGEADALPEEEVLARTVGDQEERRDPPAQSSSSVECWRDKIAPMAARGAGPTAIYDFLRLREPGFEGSLSAIKSLCARMKKERGPRPEDVAIPVETVAGEVAQVDFGYVGRILDPERQALRKAWVFVMTLGHSRHFFCDIVFDQKIETWLDLHVRAFAFFGGVPKVIVPDNLKAAVIRAAFGVDDDAVINRSYRELARYYGFQIDPAPPRSPEKKGKVERTILYLKRSFIATWNSVDIVDDRAALQRWAGEVAARRRHGTTRRIPIEVFEAEEQSSLRPLPHGRGRPSSGRRRACIAMPTFRSAVRSTPCPGR